MELTSPDEIEDASDAIQCLYILCKTLEEEMGQKVVLHAMFLLPFYYSSKGEVSREMITQEFGTFVREYAKFMEEGSNDGV